MPVYADVFARQRALAEAWLPIDGWRISRRIGMSGGLFHTSGGPRAARPLTSTGLEAMQARHGYLSRELPPDRAAPEAVELLTELRTARVPFAIATAERRPEIDASPRTGRIPCLRGAIRRRPQDCYVVRDAVRDPRAARRARMLSIGILSGGHGEDELGRAGAFRVRRDPSQLLESLDELGLLP